ncbi:hypothetical protein Tco_1369262 [Tanacetum coccineum]
MKLTNVKKLKLIQSPSYKLEHVKLKSRSVIRKSRVYIALLDVLLWCFRPQSLPLELGDSINKRDVIEVLVAGGGMGGSHNAHVPLEVKNLEQGSERKADESNESGFDEIGHG